MRERALGSVARANALRELAVEVGCPSPQLLEVVRERVRVAQKPRERIDLAPHQRRSERDLALEDAESVRGDERAEPEPRIVDPREHFGLDELAHGLRKLRGIRAILQSGRPLEEMEELELHLGSEAPEHRELDAPLLSR